MAATRPPAPQFHISGELALLSDYRQGGVTRSDGDPAIQGRTPRRK